MCEEEKVNRCECLGKTFAKLKEQGSLEDAVSAGAGQECEGCLPYLKLSYASGEDAFDLEDSRLSQYQ